MHCSEMIKRDVSITAKSQHVFPRTLKTFLQKALSQDAPCWALSERITSRITNAIILNNHPAGV